MSFFESKNKTLTNLITEKLEFKGIAQRIRQLRYPGELRVWEIQFNIKGLHYIAIINRESVIFEGNSKNLLSNKKGKTGIFLLREAEEIDGFLSLFSQWIDRALIQNVFLPDNLPNTKIAKESFRNFCRSFMNIQPTPEMIEHIFQEIQQQLRISDTNEFDLWLFDCTFRKMEEERFEVTIGIRKKMQCVIHRSDEMMIQLIQT